MREHTLLPGHVVDVQLSARVRINAAAMLGDVRITAMVLTFDADGRHRNDVGSAEEVDPATSSAELVLERPPEGCKQVLVLVATRNGQELPFSDLPTITLTVIEADAIYTWDAASSPNRTTLVLETYRRNGSYRLRSIDQGYLDGWSAFVTRTHCDLELPDILAATLDDLRQKSTRPKSQPPLITATSTGSAGAIDIKAIDADISLKLAESKRLHALIQDMPGQAARLSSEYLDRKAMYDRLVERVRHLQGAEEILEQAELGMYRPHFAFTDSEQFKAAVEQNRTRQKRLVTDKKAVSCSERWSVGGDLKAGQQLIDRQVKLTLRAFNGEADAAIANVTWNNVLNMEKRILTSADAINKANESTKVSISRQYVDLKIAELRLVHELHEKKKQERDQAAEQRKAQREQDRLERDAEKAEREEQKYRQMLEKALAEAERGNQTQAMREKIAQLETDLAQAIKDSERTKAMAEQTRCGFVYVISNVGSFGEGIIKIGMTRRLDPEDRVRELSGASVPFAFDVHAMIYSDVASELEATLHSAFHDRRVNVANNRKEFFQCSVDEVERAVRRLVPDAQFTRDREAREWRETITLRNQRLGQAASGFPSSL